METRGRKSESEREIAQLVHVRDDRPEPPEVLTPVQAEEWRAVVGRMPAAWFKREHYGILANYCRHVCRSNDVERELSLTPVSDSDLYTRLSIAAERETRAIIACARTLRITHQSQYDEKKAHRTVQNQSSGGGKPWDSTRTA
jgi:hypothetical protein